MMIGTAPKSLIGRCLDHCSSKEAAIILQGYPVEVLIAARIKGPVGAGESLGMEICGRPVSATPILRIVKMVESNEIPVTSEEILAVVNQDERSVRFFKQNPWLTDPTGKSAPPTKKGRKPANPPNSETNELQEAASKKRERQTRKGSTAAARPPEVDEPTEKVGDEKKTRDEMPRLTAEKLKALSQQEEEHQRQAVQPKKPEPAPPQFRGTPAPPLKASEEEREAWRRLRKQEMAEFVESARSQGWEIPDDWDGMKSVAKVAKWIGLPPA